MKLEKEHITQETCFVLNVLLGVGQNNILIDNIVEKRFWEFSSRR
jgi:hypothetical protein